LSNVTPFIPANHLCLLSDRDITDPPVRVPPPEDFRVFDEDLEKLIHFLPSLSQSKVTPKLLGMITESLELLSSIQTQIGKLPYDLVRRSFYFNPLFQHVAINRDLERCRRCIQSCHHPHRLLPHVHSATSLLTSLTTADSNFNKS
jgi:hypothetical protein